MLPKILYSADEVINELSSLAKNKNLVFRGYGKQTELYPNIIRNSDLTNREIELLSNFEKYGLQYFSVNNAIDFMSYGQHFGLPTRLLDFTYNPFVALFFSLFMPKGTNYKNEEDKDFYYIRYSDLDNQIVFNSLPLLTTIEDDYFKADSFTYQCIKGIETINGILNSLYEKTKGDNDIAIQRILMYCKTIYKTTHNYNSSPNAEQLKPFTDDLLDKFHSKKILFIDANQCNNRIVMQQGLFMFPYNLDKKMHLETIEKNTYLIKIHKSTRRELLDYLDTLGINSYRLMPDLQSICYAIKRNVIDERKESSSLFKKITQDF